MSRYQELLSHSCNGVLGIYEDTTYIVSHLDRGIVQPKPTCFTWLCTLENAKSCLGIATSQHLSKQMTPPETCSIRVLWQYTYPRFMVSRITTNYVHPDGWQFWCQYVSKDYVNHLITSIKKGLHPYQGLVGGPILWNTTWLGLRQMDCGYINAGICKEKIAEVWACHEV